MITNAGLTKRFQTYRRVIESESGWLVEGKVTRMVGLTLEAVGCHASVGSKCLVVRDDHSVIEAEIVGFADNKSYLMCVGEPIGVAPGAKIIATGETAAIPVGPELLGRIVDAAAKPLDGKGPLLTSQTYPLQSEPINPLARDRISTPIDVGVQAINGLFIRRAWATHGLICREWCW